MSTTTTTQRRQVICEILEERPVQSQAQLLELLAARGHQATQPALSRDLRALGVAKQAGTYQLLEEERVTPLEALRSLLRGVKNAGENLVVLVCEPGAASAVARALESEAPTGLVGTVAGDDTVFAAVTGRDARVALESRVHALLST